MSLFGSGLGARSIQSHVGSRSGGGFDDQREQEKRRQRKAARRTPGSADLSGFFPGLNPEIGPAFATRGSAIESAGRISQQRMISELFGGPRESVGRRAGREISGALRSLLGVRLEGAIDRPSGTFGVRGRLNPISLVGGFQTFGGTLSTLSAIATGGIPLTSGLAALAQTLSGPSQLTAAGNLLNISIPLGFRPTLPEHLVRDIVARGKRVGRDKLTETERVAFDFAQAQEQGQSVERGGDRVSTAAAPQRFAIARAAPGTSGPAGTRASGRARGLDADADVDLLRTQRQADVAAGLAPARPALVGRAGRTRII